MEENVKTTVEMTQEEAAQFAAYRAECERKAAAERRRNARENYRTMVDETIDRVMPTLVATSTAITDAKRTVLNEFRAALDLKADLFGVRDDQRSHTFTNSEGTRRIIVGQYTLDNYSDTVNEGIAIVKEYLGSLAKDKESESLVKACLRLMSRDQVGNLKASRVLQLRRMAEESGNERFQEGVRIIEESYAPETSRQFLRVEERTEGGAWKQLPLGMTEA